ncbi:MAG: hypothetical protein WBO17_10230, partial [Sphingorhabdus sp.]
LVPCFGYICAPCADINVMIAFGSAVGLTVKAVSVNILFSGKSIILFAIDAGLRAISCDPMNAIYLGI